jgi:hypothetical protein
MENINNSNEYDNYLISYVNSYMVTEFLGRGQYQKKYYDTLAEAISYQSLIKSKKPNARILIYGISNPPHSIQPVTIAIGV